MPDLNLIIVVSLFLLALCSFGVLITLIILGVQLSKTLSSAQSLMSLIQNDLEPTVKEIKEGVANVKNILGKYTTPMSSALEKASVTVSSLVHGVQTGVKSYFSSGVNDNTEEETRQATKQDIEI